MTNNKKQLLILIGILLSLFVLALGVPLLAALFVSSVVDDAIEDAISETPLIDSVLEEELESEPESDAGALYIRRLTEAYILRAADFARLTESLESASELSPAEKLMALREGRVMPPSLVDRVRQHCLDINMDYSSLELAPYMSQFEDEFDEMSRGCRELIPTLDAIDLHR